MKMKYLRKINEYLSAPAEVETEEEIEVDVPSTPSKRPFTPDPPRRDDEELPGPRNKNRKNLSSTINSLLHRIVNRYNSLVSGKTNESIKDNRGIPQSLLDKIAADLPEEDVQGFLQDGAEIVEIIQGIKSEEDKWDDNEKKEMALNIVRDIFKGKRSVLDDIDFELTMLDGNIQDPESDLFKAKRDIPVGKPPAEVSYKKGEVREEDPDFADEMDIQAIQHALSNGFASEVASQYVQQNINPQDAPTEIEGVGFDEYYRMMKKTLDLHSKVPGEHIHQVLTNSPAVGRVDVVWNNDTNKYVIKAEGYTILVLVHEMVKGIYELMSLFRQTGLGREKHKEMKKWLETQHMEREAIKFGHGISRSFREFFNKVEDNLIDDGSIQEKSGEEMMMLILGKMYQLEKDLFLKVSHDIFDSDVPDDQKPYVLFECFYMEILDGDMDTYDCIEPFVRSSDDSSVHVKGNYDSFSVALKNAIGNEDYEEAGNIQKEWLRQAIENEDYEIASQIQDQLNPGSTQENLKYIMPFNKYLLLESVKDRYKKFVDEYLDAGDDGLQDHRSEVATYIDEIRNITSKEPSEERLKAMIADLSGINNPPGWNEMSDIEKWNSRKNVESYETFDELKKIVDNARRVARLTSVEKLEPGSIGAAVSVIQQELGITDTGEKEGSLLLGYYGSETADAIKSFQETYSTAEDGGKMLGELLKHADHLEEPLAKFLDKHELSTDRKDKTFKDVLGEFLKDVKEIEANLVTEYQNKQEEISTEPRENKEKIDELRVQASALNTKIQKLRPSIKDLKSAYTGGLTTPSGIADLGTLTALELKTGKQLPGVKGNVGTFARPKGKKVYSKDGINIYKVLSNEYCATMKKQFAEVLKEAVGGESNRYGWCIANGRSTHYEGFRDRKETLYFIENTKRAVAEGFRYKEFAGQEGGRGSITEYKEWACDQGEMSERDKQGIVEWGSRLFYDNYHVAVLFVVDTPPDTFPPGSSQEEENSNLSYWLVSASNDGEWGNAHSNNYPHFSFKKISDVIWPVDADASRRSPVDTGDQGSSAKGINVPQNVIDSDAFVMPSEEDINEMIKALQIEGGLTYHEQKERNKGSHKIINNATSFDLANVENKEAYLSSNHWHDAPLMMKRRNETRIGLPYWEAMPRELKMKHLKNSWTGLDDKMFNEIKDDKQLVRQHKEFLRQRLYGEDGHGGLIEDIENLSQKNYAVGEMMRQLKTTTLQPNEYRLLPRFDMENDIIAAYNAIYPNGISGFEVPNKKDAAMKAWKELSQERKLTNAQYEELMDGANDDEKGKLKPNLTVHREGSKPPYWILWKESGLTNKQKKGQKEIKQKLVDFERKINAYADLDKRYVIAVDKILGEFEDESKKKNKERGSSVLMTTDSNYKEIRQSNDWNKRTTSARYGNPAWEKAFGGEEYNNLTTNYNNVPWGKNEWSNKDPLTAWFKEKEYILPAHRNKSSYISRLHKPGNRPKGMEKWKDGIHPFMRAFLDRLVLNDTDRTPSIDKLQNLYKFIIKMDSALEANYLFRIANSYYNLDGYKEGNISGWEGDRLKKLDSRGREKLIREFDSVIDHYNTKYNGAFDLLGNRKKLKQVQKKGKSYGEHTETMT